MVKPAKSPKHWLIIPAAGIGSRMGASIPKQYLQLGGRPLLECTLDAMLSLEWFESVLVGLHPDDKFYPALSSHIREQAETYEGGEERAVTVVNGLLAIEGRVSDEDWIWVHDAARPFVTQEELQSLRESLKSSPDGALLALQATDTMKALAEDGRLTTLDRRALWRAQTPQVFPFGLLSKALVEALGEGRPITDESSAIELYGGKPKIVPGKASNIKVTFPEDLAQISDSVVQSKSGQEERGMATDFRVGNGFDVHAFEEGDHIMLGGERISYDQGLKAHSDGDVLLHALCDAILGALALGDIGHHFPDTDPEWSGADSRALLRAVMGLIRERGYQVVNADTTIIAQAPKMAPHIKAMRENISEDLGLERDRVSVKATTTEKLGFTGRKEGIACQATVLLVKG